MITIITPTLGRDPEIVQRCIHSVLSQTYTDYKHFICSDGIYEKNIQDLVNSFNDSRIRYGNTSRKQGHYGAGVRSYCGEYDTTTIDYLVYLDDDNIIFPQYLEKMLKSLENTPDDIGFAICKIIHMGPLPSHLGNPPQVLEGFPSVQNIDTLQIMVKKNVVDDLGWILNGYMSDGYTYEQWASHYSWTRVPEILGIHM